MAAMDSAKLSTMTSRIQSAADAYNTDVTTEVSNMEGAFNSTWISNNASVLAGEISQCLESLATTIQSIMNSKNNDIQTAVTNFNNIEGENISYSGFTFSKPTTTLALNSTLPNGKIGVMEGATVEDLATPMKNLVAKVDSAIQSVVDAVSSSDAFDSAEISSLTSGITKAKGTFDTAMEEFISSLGTRLEGEQVARSSMDTANNEMMSN